MNHKPQNYYADYNSLKVTNSSLKNDYADSEEQASSSFFGILLFAEAGKKKKKEKSEVVVISVNNPGGKSYGGYPIFIPSCGGHHGGYGRRKRSIGTPMRFNQ